MKQNKHEWHNKSFTTNCLFNLFFLLHYVIWEMLFDPNRKDMPTSDHIDMLWVSFVHAVKCLVVLYFSFKNGIVFILWLLLFLISKKLKLKLGPISI